MKTKITFKWIILSFCTLEDIVTSGKGFLMGEHQCGHCLVRNLQNLCPPVTLLESVCEGRERLRSEHYRKFELVSTHHSQSISRV